MRQGADWLHAVRSLARTTEFASDQSSIQVPRCRRSGCRWAITRFFTATLVRIISSKSWSRRPNRSKRCGSSVTKRAHVTTRTAQRERYQPKAARQPDRIRTAAASYPRCIRAASAPYPRRIRAVSASYPRHIRVVSAPYPEASRIAEFKRSRMLAWPHRSNHERLLYGCCADGARMVRGWCLATVRMLCGYGPDAVQLKAGLFLTSVHWSASRHANANEPIGVIGMGRRCPLAGLRNFGSGDSLEQSAADRAALISAGPGQAACRRNRQQQAPILRRRGDADTLFP